MTVHNNRGFEGKGLPQYLPQQLRHPRQNSNRAEHAATPPHGHAATRPRRLRGLKQVKNKLPAIVLAQQQVAGMFYGPIERPKTPHVYLFLQRATDCPTPSYHRGAKRHDTYCICTDLVATAALGSRQGQHHAAIPTPIPSRPYPVHAAPAPPGHGRRSRSSSTAAVTPATPC